MNVYGFDVRNGHCWHLWMLLLLLLPLPLLLLLLVLLLLVMVVIKGREDEDGGGLGEARLPGVGGRVQLGIGRGTV